MGNLLSRGILKDHGSRCKTTTLRFGDHDEKMKNTCDIVTYLDKETKHYIHRVYKTTPQPKLDLRRGDIMLSINSEHLSDMNGDTLKEYVNSLDTENETTMVIRRSKHFVGISRSKLMKLSCREVEGTETINGACIYKLNESKRTPATFNLKDGEMLSIKKGEVTFCKDAKDTWIIENCTYHNCCEEEENDFIMYMRIRHKEKNEYITIGENQEVKLLPKKNIPTEAKDDRTLFKIEPIDISTDERNLVRVRSKYKCKSVRVRSKCVCGQDLLHLHWDKEDRVLSFKSTFDQQDPSYIFQEIDIL